MLLKTLFLLLHLFCNANLTSAHFATTRRSSEILILKIEMLLEFQDKKNIEIIGY